MIELHCHTYYSDGRAAPQELVNHAAKIGIKTLAITDHDNFRGNLEARPFAEQAGIDLIPAIELTTHWGEFVDLDVLAYFVDFNHADFQAMVADSLQDFRARITACCEIVTHMGYPVTYDDLLPLNPRYIGSGHLIYQLHHIKKLVPDYETGLALFEEAWKQVKPSALTTEKAIKTAKAAGGVAVLAHPVRIRTEWLTADEIKPFVEMGLGGIEVYHPSANEEAHAYFNDIADQFGLVISGSSDEHGYPDGFPRMGTQPITPEIVEALRARAKG